MEGSIGTGDSGDVNPEFEALVEQCLVALDAEGLPALERLCTQHPEQAEALRRRVVPLLTAGLVGQPSLDSLPERLGEFRIVERLGGGGMGIVYRAVQASLSREVALKVVRPEHLLIPGARERFRREVETVARLRHPGIAPVYAVGEESGVPFFAMELVEGLTLAEVMQELRGRSPSSLRGEDLAALLACRASSPDSAEASHWSGPWPTVALRIVHDVALALDHAHRRGVRHRDIKPSNVMVTASGRVLLMDFGLASTQGTSSLTATGAHLGTTPYMPPERLGGDAVRDEIAGDVYGLGVTLYELLTLQPPFMGANAEATRRLVLDGTPVHPRTLDRAISWEAETVCLVAMERDPARRYASAAAFAEDLARTAAHQPIAARRAGTILRMRRWIRRRPAAAVGIALGAATLMTLVVGIAVSTMMYLGEQRARRTAESEGATSHWVSNYLVGLFRTADPREAHSDWISAKTLLVRGAQQLAHEQRTGELAADPALVGELQAALGLASSGAGLFDVAEPLLESALTERRGRLAENHEDVVSLMTELGRLHRERGEFEAAEAHLVRALDLTTSREHSNALDVVAAKSEIAGLRHREGKYPEAEQLYREVLDAIRNLEQPAAARTFVALSDLGGLYTEMRRYDDAEPIFAEVETLAELRTVDESPDVLIVLHNLANYHQRRREFDLALRRYDQALSGMRDVYGGDHPTTLRTLSGRALVLLSTGRFDEAQADYERAITGLQSSLGNEHPVVLLARGNLAMVHRFKGKQFLDKGETESGQEELQRARDIYAELVTLADSRLELPAPDVRAWFNSLGLVQKDMGQFADAATSFREFVRRERSAEDSITSRLASGLCNLADMLNQTGEYAAAADCATEGVALTPPGKDRATREELLRSIQSRAPN